MVEPKAQEKISITHTEQGWIISCGNKSVEIGQRLEDLEKVIDAEVAPKLGVEPKELQAVRLGILAKCTEPTEGIRVEDKVITVDFDKTIKPVHPAIDIVDDIAYVGVWLPCTLVIEPRKLEEPAKVEEEDLHFLITSRREKILTNPKILRELKLKLAYQAINIVDVGCGWSLKSIKNFLDNPAFTIDPVRLYLTIKGKWKEFIETDDPRLYDLLTLWTIGTYFCSLFRCYPYLYIGGVRRAGKTKVLDLFSLLAFNAISSASLTTSALFRLIQSGRATILMDEDENLSKPDRKQEFRSVLLKGYKRGGFVFRVEEDTKKRFVQRFAVYSAKAICNISGLDDVLEDRTIPNIMKRGKDEATINREIDFENSIWQEVRDELYIFFLTRWHEIKEINDTYDSSDSSDSLAGEGLLKARDWELWRPIWVLAKFFSLSLPPEESQASEESQESLTDRIKQLAIEFSKQREIENMTETRECLLIRALLNLATKDNWYAVQAIREEFVKQFDEPQEWLSNDWIGRALKRLKFFEKRRVGTGREWFLKRTVVEDLAERMGVEKQAPVKEPLEQIGTWIEQNKDQDGMIDALKFSDFVTSLGIDPRQVIDHLKKERKLAEPPDKYLGKLLVM